MTKRSYAKPILRKSAALKDVTAIKALSLKKLKHTS